MLQIMKSGPSQGQGNSLNAQPGPLPWPETAACSQCCDRAEALGSPP